ncbi:hypothetical protein Poli38472_000689 [Pythium oligandrum]|uniref:WD40 repeat-like protein n=1 Tax=Pythium oligandrum TaxID=41045 RepID=A0A8K1FIC8_PYTOL|nr:hypothetical protein Poli38472_000689 [Pythium oligandrum]|eukprot:TMW60647.1 hypothetical protein Poli38472_000689 [Pythium oligandrum]
MAEMTMDAGPACVKHEYIGAVTLLHFSRDGYVLYVGVGSTLYLYETLTGELLASHDVFTRGILHGLDYVSTDSGNFVVVFGQKRVVCLRNIPETPREAREQCTLQRVGKAKVCGDWVFDVQILSDDWDSSSVEFPTVVLGLAHNFIQFWNPNTDEILRSVICTERCILYSLAFHGRSVADLLVASGTVFQQILLWKPSQADDSSNRVDPKQRLHGHNGVIFKLQWSNDAQMLASVSDDRTMQLWAAAVCSKALDTPYESVFRAWGHTARLWDVKFCSQDVLTVSEDAFCKLWDLDGTCVATMQGHQGKHVWRVAVHPAMPLIATGGGDGAVKLWDVEQQTASAHESSLSGPLWLQQPTEGKPSKKTAVSVRDMVVQRIGDDDRVFVGIENGEIMEALLDTAIKADSMASKLFFRVNDLVPSSFQDYRVSSTSISSFALDGQERFLLIGDSMGYAMVVDTVDQSLKAFWKAHPSRILTIVWPQDSQDKTLFTCAADGGVCEWRLTDDSTPQLVGKFRGPAKCATSCLLTIDDEGLQTRTIVCGDGRGNVYGFARSLTDVAMDENVDTQPHFVLKSVHGRDLVTTLLQHKDKRVLYSGGHDGYICTYLVEAGEGNALNLRYVGRDSIKGITTIKHLSWSSQDQLFVFGFYATHAILYNFTAQYRLFNVECGGWRRPHAFATRYRIHEDAIPAHIFVFTPPAAKNGDLHMRIHTTIPTMPAVRSCSLHRQYHGRMTTCARAVGDRLVTAGEDNSVKLHKRQATLSGKWRWECLSTGIAHTTTIRALSAFYVASRQQYIVISGGGKQRLNVWGVHEELDVLEFLIGHDNVNADQDHRILDITTFALPFGADSDRYRLVAACNSEGTIQLLLLDLSASKLTDIGECTSSKKPILSCDSIQTDKKALLAVGSTDGMVNVWNLSTVIQQIVASVSTGSTEGLPTIKEELRTLQPVHQYLAHDMGVNCLCATLKTTAELSSMLIISGGDDQSLNVRQLNVDSLEVVRDFRSVNASGSAIKTVTVTHDASVVYCAGYDQRLSQWRLNVEGTDDMLQWQTAAFTECADIADLDVWEADNKHDDVVVVGQGLQMIKF